VTSQNRYNLVEREADKELLPYLRREGIVLIAWSPLAKGVLTGKYTPENPPAFEDVRRNDPLFTPHNLKLAWPLVEEIRRLAAAYGKTPAQVALNWLVRDPWIYPIPGAVWLFWCRRRCWTLADAGCRRFCRFTSTKLGVVAQYRQTHSDAGFEKAARRLIEKRGCLFRSFSAISLCIGVPFFTLSARYSAMALLISPSLSASFKRSAVAMYTTYLGPDLTTFGLSPADSSLSAAASAFSRSRVEYLATREPPLLFTNAKCITTPATATAPLLGLSVCENCSIRVSPLFRLYASLSTSILLFSVFSR
jgi:hypothetical protein